MSAKNALYDSIKEKYSYEVEKPKQEQDIGDFKRLVDFAGQNSNPDMWSWIMQQDNVQKAQGEMESLFHAYMFELMKPQFSKYCADSSSDVIKNYVDSIISESKNYVSPAVQFEAERKQMQDMIQQQTLLIEQLQRRTEVVKI